MKIMKSSYWAILLLLTVLGACSKESEKDLGPVEGLEAKPNAAFEFEVVDPSDPFTFKFNNKSNNFKDVRWNFADDSTASDSSPTHTFLNTGTYKVKLVVLNGEGYWAQREETIKINPSSLINITTKLTGANKMEMTFNSLMTIEKATWAEVISDTENKTLSNEKTTEVTFNPGEFKRINLTVITPKKSKAQITFLLSELGVIKDLTNFDNTFSISNDNSGGPDGNEGSKKLIDNNNKTKVFIGSVGNNKLSWQFEFYEPQVINGYSMTSGNDAYERDPIEWRVEGSNDGATWTQVDYRNGEAWAKRNLPRTFTFENATAYKMYRFFIIRITASSNFQMSEVRLLQIPR